MRVKLVNTKVYKEADSSTDSVTTLNRGTLVNRKARYSNWLLVDYPSGVGELSPGSGNGRPRCASASAMPLQGSITA